jgi:hypothetical protein
MAVNWFAVFKRSDAKVSVPVATCRQGGALPWLKRLLANQQEPVSRPLPIQTVWIPQNFARAPDASLARRLVDAGKRVQICRERDQLSIHDARDKSASEPGNNQ